MSVDVRLPKKRKKIESLLGLEPKHIVSPGDVITEDTGYMRLGKHNPSAQNRSQCFHSYTFTVYIYRGRKSKLHCKEKRIIYFYYISLI